MSCCKTLGKCIHSNRFNIAVTCLIVGGILLFIGLPYAIGIIVMTTNPFDIKKYLGDKDFTEFFIWLLGLNFIVYPCAALLIATGLVTGVIAIIKWCRSEWRKARECEAISEFQEVV